jgi:hypothetical protein
MSNLVPTLLLTAMVYALGAGIASLPWHPATATAASDSVPADAAIPVLPTVVVRPDGGLASATLLPTVTVRPTRGEIAAAFAVDSEARTSSAVSLRTFGSGFGSGSGVDMPYYAFGKSVYRLRKE